MHPACRPQFAHARVDDWIPGLSTLPRIEPFLFLAPAELGKFLSQRLLGCVRKVKEQMVREFTPAKFRCVSRRPPFRARDSMLLCGMPNLAWADFAEVQMRRKS